MSSPPFMPLYVGDYLADTTHLTTTEHGAYLMLLFCMWRSGGSLPANPAKLAKLCKLTRAQWDRMSETLLAFFDIENGEMTQRRLTRELTRHTEAVRQRRVAASNGGHAKALKNKEAALATGSFPLCQPEPEPELIKKKNILTVKPDGFDQFWDLYPRKVGKGAARKAYATAIKKHPPDQILTDLKRLLPTLTVKPDFIPHASTWLNGERWDDERQEQTHTGFDLEAHNRRQKELLAMYERGEGLSA